MGFKGPVWEGIITESKSICNMESRDEVNLKSIIWAIESMYSHRVDMVILATEDSLSGSSVKTTSLAFLQVSKL